MDGIILGCTELPLLLCHAADERPDLLNPAELLATAAVKAAMGGKPHKGGRIAN